MNKENRVVNFLEANGKKFSELKDLLRSQSYETKFFDLTVDRARSLYSMRLDSIQRKGSSNSLSKPITQLLESLDGLPGEQLVEGVIIKFEKFDITIFFDENYLRLYTYIDSRTVADND